MGFLDFFKSKSEPICPSCNQPIEVLPKRSGTCKHCRQKYYMCKDPENDKYIFTNSEGKKAIEKKKLHLMCLEGAKNNRASFEEAMKNCEGVKKIWMFCATRWTSSYCIEYHQEYESLGPVEMTYEFAPGLKYPGDHHCKDSRELEGCLCTIGYEVD